MLGAPGVYFLYYFSYLGCVGRMVSGFCTILLRVPPYSSSCWSATTKTLHRVRVETTCRHLRLETLPLSTCCTFVIFVGAFVAVLWSIVIEYLPSTRLIKSLCGFDRSSSCFCRQDGLFFSLSRRLYLRQLLFCFCHGVVVAMIVAVRSIVVFVLIVKSYLSPTRQHHVRLIMRSFRPLYTQTCVCFCCCCCW